MKKSILTAALAATATTALLLSGCSAEAAPEVEAGTPITLTLGHGSSETDPRHAAALQFKQLVEEASDGMITVEVHAANTLGTNDEMIEGLQLGTIDLVMEGLLLLEPYTDLAAIESAPFIYPDEATFFEVWEGEIGAEIKAAITEESGYAMLGNLYRGPRQLTTISKVETLDDLQGLTVRTPTAATMVRTWESLGARAEAMAFSELYSALEAGVLDGQENPLDAILFNSLHEVAPYVGLTSHLYANLHFIAWEESLAKLPADYRTIIEDAANKVGQDFTAESAANQVDYINQIKADGATVSEIKDIDRWIEATQPVVDSLNPKVQEWITRIRG
jgi:tripartite ATP-independent transporter DctP family solute receptor